MAKHILVQLNQWERGESGDLLEAINIHTSIAVALSDMKTGNGFLGYFSPDATTLTEMLAAAAAQAVHPQYVNVWYGGACLASRYKGVTGNPSGAVREFRIRTSRMLATRGFTLHTPAWLTRTQRLTARLVVGTNHCPFVIEP